MLETLQGSMERQTVVRPSRALLIAGLLSAVIYLMLVSRLSWLRYGGRPQSWAQLLGAGGETGAICLGGIGLLMALYLWGRRCVRTGQVQRQTIWAFALVFAGVLLWLLPITSDLFSYLGHAHMVTDLGANPLLQAPSEFEDPLMRGVSTAYAVRPTVYGPAWVLLSAIGTVGPNDLGFGLLYLMGLAVAAYMGSAWLVERILLQFRPKAALEGLYLFAWSPFVLLMAAGDGHNDVVMMALALLSLWLLLSERWMLALGVLALSVWIKYVSLVLVPLVGIYMWQHLRKRSRRELLGPLAHGFFAATLVSFAALAPLGRIEALIGIVERLMHPLNWRAGAAGLPALVLAVGLFLSVPIYLVLLVRAARGSGSFQQLANVGFVALLLTFVLGAARSQPWHLLWPASVAGLSDHRWAVPLVIGLSGIMLAVQVWVEWAMPGFACGLLA